MILFATIAIAAKALRRNLGRSGLTVLGIVIGISSVILMTSLGAGAQAFILGQLKGIGSNELFVQPGAGDKPNGPPLAFNDKTLTMADYQTIKRLPSVQYAAPLVISQSVIVAGTVSRNAMIVGSVPDAFPLNSSTLRQGLFFTDEDVRGNSHVAVIGSEIADKLFTDGNAVGRVVRIDKINFRVIGALNSQGTRFFQTLDDRVYVPVTVAQRELLGISHVNFIAVAAAADLAVTTSDLRETLRSRHNIVNPDNDLSKDNFKIQSQVDAAQTFTSVSSVLTLFLAAIAAISLIVGGIGIMNIMLASVTERTREVGLRKSVGATNGAILLQFLTESVMLTLIGGIVGILLGSGLSFIIGLVVRTFTADWTFSVPANAVALALAVAGLVGIVFGLYPARKAAKLSPIDALRYE